MQVPYQTNKIKYLELVSELCNVLRLSLHVGQKQHHLFTPNNEHFTDSMTPTKPKPCDDLLGHVQYNQVKDMKLKSHVHR